MGLILAGLGGLAAGGAHVVSGPDHLAAVLPLSVRGRWRAALTGAWWGLGHALGVLVLGLLGQLLRGIIDVEAVSAWSELLVGFLLVAVGAWALWQARAGAQEARRAHSHSQALGIGFLHGTAGAGHLFGVLPSLALPLDAALAYLAMYMFAAIASMTAFSLGIGLIVHKATWVPWAARIAGVVAIAVGVFWVGGAIWPAEVGH